MPDSLLTILKFLLVALIYLFFFRVLRAVWAEVQSRTDGTPSSRQSRSSSEGGPARAARSAPGGRLKILQPKARKGHAFVIGEEITVGRAPGCGVKLDEDIAVSQLHARIFQRDGQYYVEDLGSKNGTHVYRKGTRNPEPVTGVTLLRPGDVLAVGQTLMELTK